MSHDMKWNERGCEWLGCYIERDLTKMKQAPSGSWYCPRHFTLVMETEHSDVWRDRP